MDELTKSLATSFSVTSDPNSTSAPHPRFSEYKRKESGADQDARRRGILEQQKNRRFDFVNYMRRVIDDDWEGADDLADEDEDAGEEMEVTPSKVKRTYKPGRYYRNQLMLSEWMVEVPEDFEENWLMVCCPWGKRCLVVASRGTTTAYGRNGYRLNSFPSHLPGGNRKQQSRENAILDCIYHEVEKTFYVLDVMNWKNHPVYDSETDFRFFWMMSKLQETPEVSEKDKLNPYKFVPLKYHDCKKENLQEVFDNTKEKRIMENQINIMEKSWKYHGILLKKFDGCLFYHKRAHYTFGSSPLVVWLKPYMIPEMLQIEVPEVMMSEKPANYTTYNAHLEHVKETREKREKERKERNENRRKKRGPDRSRKFKMDLMESKWLLEIPENIDEEWSMVACPIGQRCLVMALDGETKWFNKRGFKLPGYFLSLLPGGNGYQYGFGPTFVTILDCIYYEEMMTYFVLDCMKWADQDMKEMTYIERNEYMKKVILTRPEFKYIMDLNMFKFVPLYNYECTVEGMDKALRNSAFEIDGILFYKKDAKYTSGETDDVLWLKPYMLPDVFDNISVPKRFMQQKPDTYIDFNSFVEEVIDGKHPASKKKEKKKKKEFSPDVVLQLPDNPSAPGDGRKKKDKKYAQVSYYGPGIGFKGRGRGVGQTRFPSRGPGRGILGQGQNQNGVNPGIPVDSYGRVLASAVGDNQGARVYGKGTVSGYPYYGDERDMYYPDYQKPQGSGSRRIRGQPNQGAFGMGDMEAALSYYGYDQSPPKPQQRRGGYKMF